MSVRGLFDKSISIILTALIIWMYMVFGPNHEIKEIDLQMGVSKAYAIGEINVVSPTSKVPPKATDMSEPSADIKYSWARVAGREDAVYLNIPSNQLSNKIVLPNDPSPLIIAKYDESTSSGQIAVMRMRMVGPNLQAEIVKISPRDFKHHFGMHLYNFAMLDWNVNNDPNCNYAQKFLVDNDPPDVDNDDIRRQFTEYDAGMRQIPPFFILGLQQAKVNKSNLYWHQRLNNDPCWTKRGLKDFDTGDGMFHNMSYNGFMRLVSLTQHIHKAAVSIVATPEIRQDVSTNTKKSFFKKKVTTTVSYYLKPKWVVGTPLRAGMYSDFTMNGTLDGHGGYSFVKVMGNHNFPIDETLIYQWSQSKSGWTGIFVFLAITVIGIVTGGIAGFAGLAGLTTVKGALAGAALGAIGGLVASGFSPTTSATAHVTPFVDSSYSLNPSDAMSGDAQTVAKRTFASWISPELMNTPGGVQVFASKIDIRRALSCGGASKATDDCSTSAITQVGMDDPRFNAVYTEMFNFPHKELQKYKYPYTAE